MKKYSYLYELLKIAALSILAFLLIMPFYIMVVTSLKTNEQYYQNFILPLWPLQFGNFTYAWENIYPFFLNSVFVTTFTTLGTVLLAAVCAYVFARFKFPGKEFLYYIILMLIMVPGALLLIPQFIVAKELGMLNSYRVLILPVIASAQVMQIAVIRTFFEGLPEPLFEAAHVEGANRLQVFRFIALPLSMPIISTSAIMVAIGSWNDFLWPTLTLRDPRLNTIPVALMSFTDSLGGDPILGQFMAGYMIASIPLVILFAFGMKAFVTGITAGAIKG